MKAGFNMNKKILLDSKKNFYKGNMHCHSTLSDGNMTPEELKEAYKSKGYSFLAITDHEFVKSHKELDDDEFIAITSAEYSIKQFPEQSTLKNFNMKVCHLNFYAKEQDNENTICYNSVLDHYTTGELREKLTKQLDWERIYGADGINKLIKCANDNGFFVCYNHPRWSLENYGDYKDYDGLWGVEIFNYGCGTGGLYDYDINVYDDFLRDDKRLFASCGDDNHSIEHCFGAFVCVNAENLSYKSIIDGLLNGNFYSSMGPEITELYTENNKVYIKCSNAKQISLSTRGRRTASVLAPEGEYVSQAEFELLESDEYFRLDIIDEKGRRANTQAYYLSDII